MMRNVTAKIDTANILSNRRVFITFVRRMARGLDLVILFLLRKGIDGAENW